MEIPKSQVARTGLTDGGRDYVGSSEWSKIEEGFRDTGWTVNHTRRK